MRQTASPKLEAPGCRTSAPTRGHERGPGLGFDDACRFMASLPEHILDRYRLVPFVDGLLSAIAIAPTNLDRRADLERQRPLLLRKCAMATALQENIRGHKRRTAQAHQLYRKEVERLAKVGSRRSS